MEWGYPERPGRHMDEHGEPIIDPAEAAGVQTLGIWPLPTPGDTMRVRGEIWQAGDVVAAVEDTESCMPGSVREKLARMRALGLNVDHLVAAYYICRSDDGADLYAAFEPTYFGFSRARPNLDMGLLYGLGGAANGAER